MKTSGSAIALFAVMVWGWLLFNAHSTLTSLSIHIGRIQIAAFEKQNVFVIVIVFVFVIVVFWSGHVF